MPHLDHVVVSVANLPEAAERWAGIGLPPTTGGQHPGGTANSLVRGPKPAYIELITAADEADNHWAERVRGERGPLSFAMAVDDLEAAREAAVEAGFAPGPIRDGARLTLTGEELRWRLCDVGPQPFDPELPFLIEWSTPMPTGPAGGPVLTGIRVRVPQPKRLARLLRSIDVPQEQWPSDDVFVFGGGEDARIVIEPGDAAGDAGVRAASFEVSLAGEPVAGVVDGLEVTTTPDLRSHGAGALLPAVEAAFAGLSAGMPRWPDPRRAPGWPPPEAYSRVTDAARYRIFGARARSWVEAITRAGLADVETVAPDRVTWRTEAVPDVDGVRRLRPRSAGALVLTIGTWPLAGVPAAGVILGVGRGDGVTVPVLHAPSCGCDACDDGSTRMLEEVDEAFVHVLGGGLMWARVRGGEVTTSLHGWSATGLRSGVEEALLAGRRRPTEELRGAPWR